MQKHLILSLLLAFAIAVTCAPTKSTPKTGHTGKSCKIRKPSTPSSGRPGTSHLTANKPHAGPTSQHNSVHNKPAAPQRKSGSATANRRLSHRDLVPRAPSDTSLCGISIRGQSSSACQSRSGFVYNSATRKHEWKAWGSYSTDGLDCDHVLELQMTKAALESKGFCKAWDAILAKAKTVHVEFSSAEKTALFAPLKVAANDNNGRWYMPKGVNGDKRAFIAAIDRAGGPQKLHLNIGSPVYDYFNGAGVKAAGATMAAAVDSQASAVLDKLQTDAVSKFKAAGGSADDAENLTCDLMAEEVHFGSSTAVQTYWGYVIASLS